MDTPVCVGLIEDETEADSLDHSIRLAALLKSNGYAQYTAR